MTYTTLAISVGEDIWRLCWQFDHDAYDSVGKQMVRAVDSVGANLSEGFGRYTYRERIRFCHISRGSLQETITWLLKAKNREFITEKEHKHILRQLVLLQKMLNGYLRSLKRKQS